VSKISYLAIGALVSCSIVLMIMFSLFIGISTAEGIFIASFWGAKKFSRARFYYANAFSLVLVSSVFFSLFLYLSIGFALSLIGLEGMTRVFAYQYLTVASLGLFFNFLFSLNNSTLRSSALPTLVVKVMIITNVLNAILDPFFIFYLKLGMRGAALSTIVSLMIGIGLQFFFLRRHGFYIVFLIRRSVFEKIFRKGIFASLHLLIRIISMLILIRLVSGLSQAALSAYSTVIRIFQLLLFLIFGLANAAFVIVGQNFGAKLFDRVKKGALGVMVVGLILVGMLDLVIYILKDPIISIFIRDVYVKQIAERIIFFYFVSYPFVVIAIISARSSMALYDTKRPSLINLFNLWFFMLPMAYFLSKIYGLNGIWFSIAFSNFTSFLANAILLLTNMKKVENGSLRV